MAGMQKGPDIPKAPRVSEVSGRRVGWIVLIGIVAVFVLIELAGFRDSVPPRSRTFTAMELLKAEILREAAERDEVPASLDELSLVNDVGEPVLDGWGAPIEYHILEEQGRIALRSRGANAEIGGLAQDQDLVGIFPIWDEAGAWSPGDVKWLVDPLSYHSGDFGRDLP